MSIQPANGQTTTSCSAHSHNPYLKHTEHRRCWGRDEHNTRLISRHHLVAYHVHHDPDGTKHRRWGPLQGPTCICPTVPQRAAQRGGGAACNVHMCLYIVQYAWAGRKTGAGERMACGCTACGLFPVGWFLASASPDCIVLGRAKRSSWLLPPARRSACDGILADGSLSRWILREHECRGVVGSSLVACWEG